MNNNVNSKKNDAILIIIMLIIVIAGIVGFTFLVTKGFKNFEIFIQTTINNNKVYSKNFEEKFESITIDSASAYIEVKESDSNNYMLIIYDKDNQNLNIENDNSRLLINLKTENCKGFCFKRVLPKIELYVPKNYSGNMTINNKYGDIKISELPNINLSVKMNFGDITVAKGNKADIYNEYGDITISGIVNELSIKADCGTINVSETNVVKASNALGDIKIEKINKQFNLKNNCGDIKIGEINILDNSNIEDDLGSITIDKTNDIYIDAKTNLGDVKINNNNENSSIKLSITNHMGDITVNN